MKTDENPPKNINKNKKKIKPNINNSYFAIMKKKELKEMKSENVSGLKKLNNNLFINNNSEEKMNIIHNPKNINTNNQTQIQFFS